MQSQDSVRSAMQTAGKALEQQSGSITNTIAADLVQQCAQVLKQLQGIMVTYRFVTFYLPHPPAPAQPSMSCLD